MRRGSGNQPNALAVPSFVVRRLVGAAANASAFTALYIDGQFAATGQGGENEHQNGYRYNQQQRDRKRQQSDGDGSNSTANQYGCDDRRNYSDE